MHLPSQVSVGSLLLCGVSTASESEESISEPPTMPPFLDKQQPSVSYTTLEKAQTTSPNTSHSHTVQSKGHDHNRATSQQHGFTRRSHSHSAETAGSVPLWKPAADSSVTDDQLQDSQKQDIPSDDTIASQHEQTHHLQEQLRLLQLQLELTQAHLLGALQGSFTGSLLWKISNF